MSERPPTTSATISTYLMDQLRVHGLSFFLLGLATWYFQSENVQMRAEIKDCNSALIEMYRSDRVQMLNVIQNNTSALRDIQLDRYQEVETDPIQ